MAHSVQKGKIIAVIGDEDTVVGFLLGGIGELNKVYFVFLLCSYRDELYRC